MSVKRNKENNNINSINRSAALTAGLLILIAAVLMPLLMQPAQAEYDTITPIGSKDAKAPSVRAKSAVVYSLQLDRPVYEKEADARREPYSITKILTCYLALENLDQDEIVTVSEAATQEYVNGTSIWLKPGERISVRDLVYGAMLESGNDAAYALGEAVAGSEEAFAEMMTKQAGEWGCSSTSFVNANGWKHRSHYTTARDMAIIAKNCFKNETLLKISRTKTYKAAATNKTGVREMRNYMLLLANEYNKDIKSSGSKGTKLRIKSVKGGKTGTWEEDDCSIVVDFGEKGLDGIIVLLGDTQKSRISDAAKLMKYSHKVTPGFRVSKKGEAVTDVWVKHGAKTRTTLAVSGTVRAYPRSGSDDDIRVEMEHERIEAPVKKGDKLGKYRVYCDGELIAEKSLIASEDIGTGWLPSYIYISNRTTVIIAGIAAGLALIILLIVLIIQLRRPRYRSRH